MTLAKLYKRAAEHELIVNNMFQLREAIFGAYVSGSYQGFSLDPRFGYAQGTTAAAALEKAIEVSLHRKESKS